LKIKDKRIKLDKCKIHYVKTGKGNYLKINLGRYKKKGKIDTTTSYDSISNKHKPYAHIWYDIQKQGKKSMLIGLEVSWDDEQN